MLNPAFQKAARDPRLDFFRGLAMFVIFIAHTPRDFWALWIPARFGFSDATETFVFCSGMASAIAFGAIFDKRGWLLGAARIIHRVWQVYWAHIGLFFAVLLLMVTFDKIGGLEPRPNYLYVNSLNLQPLFYQDTGSAGRNIYADLRSQLLRYIAHVSGYFGDDSHRHGAFAYISLVCSGVRVGCLDTCQSKATWDKPREFSSRAMEFSSMVFNPLGWQLIFFTGFAFMRGWIKPPRITRGRLILAATIVVITIPFAYYRIYNARPDTQWMMDTAAWLKAQRKLYNPLIGKTQFGVLRYVHFLATAYLAWVAVGPLGARLKNWGKAQIVVDTIRKVGQQSLAVFVCSLVIAQLVGATFKVIGRDWQTVLIGNLIGFAGLIAVAHAVSWFKSQPWRQQRPSASIQATTISGSPTLPDGIPARKVD